MLPELTYHVFNRAIGNELLFRNQDNYQYFMALYKKHIFPIAKTYAYCLIPNHFHFLLQIRNVGELIKSFPKFQTLEKLDDRTIETQISKQFSNLFSAYTQAFNIKFQRKGSLFMKNFKRKAIESDEQWQETFLYIHLNPVKHGLISEVENWRWNSWNAYLNSDKPSLIDRGVMLDYFDSFENLRFCADNKKEAVLSLSLELQSFIIV